MSENRWLITGASGQLGGHVLEQLAQQQPAPTILALAGQGEVNAPDDAVRRVDLRDEPGLRACVADFRPTHILHLGAMTAVGDAYANPEDANRINTIATSVLAESAAECGARFVFSSTDMVFDGTAAPYKSADPPTPTSHYGRTKVAAERILLEMANTLVVRVPLMYGVPCTSRSTTFVKQIEALRNGQPLRLFTDEFRTPIWLADAARAMIALSAGDDTGLFHVAGPQRLSRYEMGAAFAAAIGVTDPQLEAVSRLSIEAPEPRPADLSLDDTAFRQRYPTLIPKPITAALARVH